MEEREEREEVGLENKEGEGGEEIERTTRLASGFFVELSEVRVRTSRNGIASE